MVSFFHPRADRLSVEKDAERAEEKKNFFEKLDALCRRISAPMRGKRGKEATGIFIAKDKEKIASEGFEISPLKGLVKGNRRQTLWQVFFI